MLLKEIGIVSGDDGAAAEKFESLLGDFRDVGYCKPSDYVKKYWEAYSDGGITNKNLNGKVFEYIIATLCIREGLMPLYLEAQVAFVPNVNYDVMFYSAECGPICWSLKTSLRERYKQADLEAIALKYVHRKAKGYLLTLNEKEAVSVSKKIKKGDVIGLDDVILADSCEIDDLVTQMKQMNLIDPGSIEIVKSTHIITHKSYTAVQ